VLNPGDQIGEWVVERPLGEGGMGAVFLCHNVLSDRIRSAIKVLKPAGISNARERFIREVETMALLRHDAIVKVTGGGEDAKRGLLYLVMEYVEGRSLRDRLAQGPLDEEEAVRLFWSLTDGLAHAHASNIRHRDIKPANIMLTGAQTGLNAQAKLIDFGIAVQDGRTRLTNAGMLPGTLAYIPPEAFAGTQPDPTQMDVYALGQVLFEALTGEEAFGDIDTMSGTAGLARVMGAKLGQPEFDPGDGFSDGIRELVRLSTHPDPAQRLGDMEAMRAYFDHATGVSELPRRADPPTGRFGGSTRVPSAFDLPVEPDPTDTATTALLLDPLTEEVEPVDPDAPSSPSVPNVPSAPPAQRRSPLALIGVIAFFAIGGVAFWSTRDAPIAAPVATTPVAPATPKVALLSPADGQTVENPVTFSVDVERVAQVRITAAGTVVGEAWDPSAAPEQALDLPSAGGLIAVVLEGLDDEGVVVARQPITLELSASKPATSRPTASKPAVTRPAATSRPAAAKPTPTKPAAATGTVKVVGDAQEVWFVGGGERYAPGQVPVGSYTIEADFGGGRSSSAAGSVVVSEGQIHTVKCSRSFSTCR